MNSPPSGPPRSLRDQFRALRAAEFPWTADTVYLNNASIGPIPERTRRALDEFTAKRTAPISARPVPCAARRGIPVDRGYRLLEQRLHRPYPRAHAPRAR